MATEPEFVVHIIESPSLTDIAAGTEEGTTLCQALKYSGIEAELYKVKDLEVFFSTCGKIMAYHHFCKNKVPIIHLSMHGDKNGIAFTSGQLNWPELAGYLGFINKLFAGRLRLVMSTCSGFHGLKMAHMAGENPPFYDLVGPVESVAWKETVAAFVGFYYCLIRGNADTDKATAAMNAVLNKAVPIFATNTAVAAKEAIDEAILKKEIDSAEWVASIKIAEAAHSAFKQGFFRRLVEHILAAEVETQAAH